MWHKKSSNTKPYMLVALCGLLALSGLVNATYSNTGVKTQIYATDPQITTQTVTTHHRTHQYVPVSGDYQYSHSHLSSSGNDNSNYQQPTISHQSRGSSSQWVPISASSSSSSSYGSNGNSHYTQQQQQHGSNYHHEAQPQHQSQQQPIYERSRYTEQSQQTAGKWQDSENAITDYYTGCPSGHTGQLPYAYDCRRFLNCWKGRGHIQSCSVATVFNPETLECDRPDKVKCGANLGSSGQTGASHTSATQGRLTKTPNYKAGRYVDASTDSVDILCPANAEGLQPHPSDCTKFINCANGNVHIQDCGPGTAFSVTMKVCDFKDKVDCSGRGDLREVSTARQDKSLISCPSDASGLYPHPYDCTKFLQCANGQTYIQDCGPGTGFDSTLLICDYKEKVNCASGSSWGASKASGKSYEVHSETEHEHKSSTNAECPHGVTGLYAHPRDCEKFLQCSNGQTYIQSCGPGTGFDSIRLVCDYKEKVQCGPGCIWGTSATHEIATQHVHTQQTTSTTSGSGHSDLPHTADILCLNGITGLFAYPFDYTKFINCKNGNTAIQNCVQGTAFSISKGYCESLDQIQKTDHVMYIVSEVSYEYAQTLITCPPGTEGIHLYPFNGEKYIKCLRSQMEVITCPSSKVFSTTRRMCLPIGQVLKYERVRLLSELQQQTNSYRTTEDQYDVHSMIYCPPSLVGTYPHPFESSKYIRCGGGRMTRESCTSGKAYSLSRKECEMKEEVDTTDRIPNAQMTYGQEWRVNDLETTYGSIDGLTYLMCPPGLNGIFVHPFDCTKYLECDNGATKIESCSNGAVYSITNRKCIPRDKVEAYDRVEYLTSTKHEFSDEHVLHLGHDLGVSCSPGTFGIYPHPQDCHKFMRCANGRISVENCPPGKVFSIERSVCHNENEVLQHDRSSYTRSQANHQQNSQTQHGQYGSGATSGTTATHYQSGAYEPNGQYGHGAVPTTTTTNQYDSGAYVPIGQQHATGHYGNGASSTTYHNAGNGAVPTTTTTNQYDSGAYVPIGQQHATSHYGNGASSTTYHNAGHGAVPTTTTTTNQYDSGVYIPGGQQHSTSHFGNGAATTTYLDAGVYAPATQSDSCPPNSNGRFPHAYDCTKFIMCSNGVAHIQSCGPGTAWNKAMEVCDFKDKVDCSQNGAATLKGSSDISCPHGAEGLYQHPYDWHKYLSCANGITHIMDCGPGTVFSVSRKICDLEKNVINTDRCNKGVYSSDYDYSYTQNYNNRDPKAYGATTQWSYTGTHQQPPTTSHTHTQTGTVNQQGQGDRWTNMNVARPQGSTYDQQSGTWQHGSTVHTTGNRPQTTNVWSGTAVNIDQQSPTHTVLYEEGSLRPDSKYNHQTIHTPLAPFSGPAITSTSTIVHAQPIGSQEASEEVFGPNNPPAHAQYPYHDPHHNPNLNRHNHTRNIHYVSTGPNWIPLSPYPNVPVITHLMPPPQGAEPESGLAPTHPIDQLMPPYQQPPGSYNVPYPHGDYGQKPLNNLMPPINSNDDRGQRTLTDSHHTINTINVDNYPRQPGPYDLNEFEPEYSGSHKVVTVDESNMFGDLRPPFADSQTTTPPNFLDTDDKSTQIPSPTRATTPIPLIHGYPKLSNATIQTFPNQPHYSDAYSEVTHSRNATWIGRKLPQHSAVKPSKSDVPKRPEDDVSNTTPKSQYYVHNVPSSYISGDQKDTSKTEINSQQMNEALQLLLRPYFNRSGTVDDDVAFKAQSHIMSLVMPIDRTPEKTTTTHNPLHALSISIPSTTPRHGDVELILAGEQHNLVSSSSQPGAHETSTLYDLHHSTVESQRSTSAGNSQEHSSSNWHKHHQSPSPSKNHHHTPEFHEKHPHLPNPFEETPETLGIDVRSGDGCGFNCGNGKCIGQHEVCNGVNNCGNRKDEEQCHHLGYEVRLTGGESSNKGRVEVKILGKWGYVCDDKFGLKDADVVCRELGFKMGAMEVRGSSYYPPTDPNHFFNMDELECKGNETSLRECDFKGWGVHNCGPDEVVGVVCKVQKLKCPQNYWLCSKSEECIPTAFLCDVTPDCADGSDESPKVCNAPIEYRLEGGRTKNEGRLEVFYRGEWGTVCDDDFSMKEAQVACNSMGFYGRPQVAKNIYGPGSGPIWLDQVSCVGNETTLNECHHWTWGENNCQHTEDVGLQCTVGPKPNSSRLVPVSNTNINLKKSQLEYEQSELDDLGKYQGLWQRSSKTINQQKQCGHFKTNLIDEYAHPEERVINGSIAKRGRHPWQATIRTRGRGGISSHWCGAVIISKKIVMTAAHCLAGYPKGSYFVRVGDHYANIAEASEIDSNIENWYIHEKFRDDKHMNNDIALILLKNPLRFNDYVQPICLPEKGAELTVNRRCTISGWGSIKSGTSTPSNILRAAEVPILSDEVCSQKDVYGNALSEGMFCAGFLDESVDACDGDSGGPLVCSDDDGETLYGIISWGQHCGFANHPGVYVRVEKYIDWVYDKINVMIQQGKL